MNRSNLARIASLGAFLFLIVSSCYAFDIDKIYIYDFEGTVDTRESSSARPQHAGLALKSPVSVEQKSEDQIVVKFEKPLVATYNDITTNLNKQDRNFLPIEGSQSLDKAFTIYLKDGVLKSFDIYKDEPKWVSNLKRGLLSFFQIKLTPESVYSVEEPSVVGVCETNYIVLESEGYMNVTKTRNFDKCTNRYWREYFSMNAQPCSQEEPKEEFQHSGATFSYNLRGNRKNNVMEQATLNDYVRFSEYSRMIVVESTFKLQLISELFDASLKVEDNTYKNYQIHYDTYVGENFYADTNLEEAHYISQIYGQTASEEQVLDAIDDLVKEQQAYNSASESQEGEAANKQFSTRFSEQYMRLVNHISTLDGQKLENLFSEVDSKGESHKRIFFNSVSTAGTNPAFMFMKKQIEYGDLPAVRQTEFLSRIAFNLKVPSKKLFEEYINMCKSEKIQSNLLSKRLCTLQLASVIHRYCVKSHVRPLTAPPEAVCRIDTAEEFYEKILASVQPSSSGEQTTIGDKMLAIKVAGEIGVKPSLTLLSNYVKQYSEHPTVRAAALLNMKKLSVLYSREVKSIAIPLFYDRNELLEVRIAAFFNWRESGMELHELEHLSKQMMTEPNRQLVTYLYTFITSYAKKNVRACTHLDLLWIKASQHVEPILRAAMEQHGNVKAWDSQASLRLSSSMEDYHYWTRTLMSFIFSNESFAPSNLYFELSEVASGSRTVPMIISIQTHGLDKLIKKVIGINGMLSDKENLLDLFSLKKRQKRQVADRIKQEIQEIDKGIKLNTRDFDNVYIAATFSSYGRVMSFNDIDSEKFKKMASEDGTIKIPNIAKIIQAFENFTSQTIAPLIDFEILTNQLGLPIYNEKKILDYKTFRLRNLKFDVEPGFFKDERAGKPVTKVQAAIDAKVNKLSDAFTSTGVLMTNTKQKIGTGFFKRTIDNVPIKMSIDANMPEKKITIKREPIHNNLVHIKSYPVSFIKRTDPAERVNRNTKRRPEEWRPFYDFNKSKQMEPFEFEFMTPLAIGVRVEGKHRADQDYSMSSWRRYLATSGLDVIKFVFFHSPTAQPSEMKISTITTKENPTKEMTTILTWKHYHEDDPIEERNSIDIDLEKFTSKDSPLRPTTVAYSLTTLGGSEKERKLAIDIHYSRSYDRLSHKWYVFYERTPLDLSSPTSEVTNLCWLGQIRFPKYPIDKFLALDLLNMDHSANMTSEITFGNDCATGNIQKTDSKVSLEAKFDWSQDQKDQITSAISARSESVDLDDAGSVTQNKFKQLYDKCINNRKQLQTPMDQACLSFLHKATELTNIQATFNYKNIPKRWTKLLKKLGSLYTLARATYIDELDDSSHYESNDGHDNAFLNANMTNCPVDRKLTYKFETPGYRVSFKNLPISFSPLSSFPLLGFSDYKISQTRMDTMKTCSIGGNSVTTFDNMTMKLPDIEDDCFKVLSKDCSPEKNFMVLGAKKGKGKSMCVYLGKKFKIDFTPNTEGTKMVDIKVNEDTVNVEQSKPYKKDTMFGEKLAEAFKISYNGAFYTLSSKTYKFSAMTNGEWILINQANYYAGKSCGICGDANGEQTTELRSPTGCLYKNSDDFIWSYTVPSTCKSRPTIKAC